MGAVRTAAASAARRARTDRWHPSRDQLEILASLTDSGVLVDDAFAVLERMATVEATRIGAGTVARMLREGAGLADALERVGAPEHIVALVAAGERTGRTSESLRVAGSLTGRLETVRTTIGRALVYPGVVLGVGVGMLVLISVAVVPQLERTFLDLGGELPRPTRIVLTISAVLRSLWLAPVLGGLLLVRRQLAWIVDRVGVRKLVRRLPLVRRFHTDLAVTVIARLTATLLAGGVPYVEALRGAAHGVAPGSERDRVGRAASSVEAGGSALDDAALGPLIGPVDREILTVAERTGLLAEQWQRVADRRAEGLDELVTRVGAALEPLLVVVVGGLVGGAVLALYLPTFRILDLL